MQARYHIGMVLEQALGHVTHTQNLQAALGGVEDVRLSWLPLPFAPQGLLGKLPLVGQNWTIRAGLLARQALRKLHGRPDALLFHTQVPAMLAIDWMREIPAVVSLDATPLQYDQLGEFYGHTPSAKPIEWLKHHWHRTGFHAAKHLVTWSAWAARSLVHDYHIPAERISIIPPGVNLNTWRRPTPRNSASPVRILFVGGDLERKGGLDLLAAFRMLRDDPDLPTIELHLVTRSNIPAEPGVVVHQHLQPNSPELVARFHASDIFCLPTRGDCLPMVLAEAGAAGLPLIATNVAAIPEIVQPGKTGILIPPRDVIALIQALRQLILDPTLRERFGRGAAALIAAEHDAEVNAQRLVGVLKQVADRARGRSLRPALLTVSGVIDPTTQTRTERGERPRADYHALAAACDADILDYTAARAGASRIGGLLEQIGGPNLLLAWECFRRRRAYQAILTDGEQVGMPLALMLRLSRSRNTAKHLMIVHVLSAAKKMVLFDLFGLHHAIDRFIVYATWQKQFIERRWGVPGERVLLSPFMVDTGFFHPTAVTANPQPMICSVGLERRDYPTLMQAVHGLPAQVVIAAASPWSKQPDQTKDRTLPENVLVQRYSQYALRQLYADCRFLVMPLQNVTFQAGVTAILEAMAMGKAVICTRTPGQTDVVIDGETGIYVPPGDPIALRAAIERLLHNPAEAERMGAAGRQRANELMNLDRYAGTIGNWTREAIGMPHPAPTAISEEVQYV